jgi:hypothetical protein
VNRRATTAALGALLLLVLTGPAGAAESAAGIFGRWVVNEEETRAAQPPERKRSASSGGVSGPTVVVGGMPVPGTVPDRPAGMGGPAPDPMVLRVNELTVEAQGDDALHITYHGEGSETLERGRHHGALTRWSANRMTTGYSTTSRRVNQTWEIRKDGRLLVTVKIRPNQGHSTTSVRVFDRAS